MREIKKKAFRALKRELKQKKKTTTTTRVSKGFTKTFLEYPRTEMEGMDRVFDIIIGVFKDDRRRIPLTALDVKVIDNSVISQPRF